MNVDDVRNRFRPKSAPERAEPPTVVTSPTPHESSKPGRALWAVAFASGQAKAYKAHAFVAVSDGSGWYKVGAYWGATDTNWVDSYMDLPQSNMRSEQERDKLAGVFGTEGVELAYRAWCRDRDLKRYTIVRTLGE